MNKYVKQFLAKNYLKTPKTVLKMFCTPKNIIVEPVAGCNVSCSACPQDVLKRPKGVMTLETYNNIINKIHPKNVGLYFMGEPFLNPDIFEMIETAYRHGIKTNINTNGTTLYRDHKKVSESHLDKITIAIDGVSQKTFEAYRKGINAESVWSGVEKLSKAKKGPHIAIRTLAFRETLKEVPLIKAKLHQLDITDFRLLTPVLTNWGGKQNKDIDQIGYTGRYKLGTPEICPALFRLAISWDGYVLPCCNDVHGECVYGNINEDKYPDLFWGKDMWRIKAMRKFSICENCTEDED